MKLDAEKGIFTNCMWAILALAAFQGILQFVAYPSINSVLGAEMFGGVLYVVALLSVFAPAIGNASGNVRLMKGTDGGVNNGDFLLHLSLQTIIISIAFVFLCKDYIYGAENWLLLLLTFTLTALRSYCEAEYRLSLDFKGYFFYYLLLSVGYLLGSYLLRTTQNWIFCFLLGELFCVSLSAVKGGFFRPLLLSEKWRAVGKQSSTLMGAYIFNNSIGFLDRILLQQWMDSTSVSIYYVSSIAGKILVMLVVPLNNVVFSYLIKRENKINRHLFLSAFLRLFALSIAFYGVIMLVSPAFVRLLYCELYEPVIRLLWIVSLSQVICAVASTLMMILLKERGVTWQFRFQLLYFMQYCLLSFVGIKLNGLKGFAIFGLVSNLLQLTIVLCVGIVLMSEEAEDRKR